MSTITYTNRPLTDAIARRIGRPGFAAYLNVGEPIKAYDQILPKSLETAGAKINKDVAKAIIGQLLTDINNSMKENGQPVVIGDVLKFNVRSRAGLLTSKSSTIKKSDLRIIASFLKGKEDFEFSLRNTVDGVVVALNSATGVTDGREIDTYAPGENVRLNGKNLVLLEGDYVEVSAQVGDVEFGGRCTVVESAADHIIVTPPRELYAVPAGTDTVWTVHGKGGKPDEGQMDDTQHSTLLAYTGESPLVASVQDGELAPNTVTFGDGTCTIKGAGLMKATTVKFGTIADGRFDKSANGSALAHDGDNTLTCKFASNSSGMTDEELLAASAEGRLYLAALGPNGFSSPLPVKYVVSA